MSSRPIVVVLLAMLAQGCAGVHWNARTERIRYPVSFSPALPDGDGRTLLVGEGLEKVADLELHRTVFGILYGTQTTDLELSEDLNREVEAAKGEGIANLAMDVRACVLSWFFPLNLLPFFPGCQDVAVTGTIVKRRIAGGDRTAANQGVPR